MNEAERVVEAKRWLRYAEEDLSAADALLGDEVSSARHVCWLAQQAAEKTLKAVLVLEQIDFPRTHDLDALRNLLPGGWTVKNECPDLAELTEWAVEARYPGDWAEPTEKDARAALEQARMVASAVSTDLSARGVSTGDSSG